MMEQVSQRRGVSYKIRHKSNPYLRPNQARSAMIYQPDDYTLTKICALSARAIRVLMIIAANYDPATGLCHCATKDMQRMFTTLRVNLSHATGELIEAGLLAKGRALGTYFINPKAFKAVTIDF